MYVGLIKGQILKSLESFRILKGRSYLRLAELHANNTTNLFILCHHPKYILRFPSLIEIRVIIRRSMQTSIRTTRMKYWIYQPRESASNAHIFQTLRLSRNHHQSRTFSSLLIGQPASIPSSSLHTVGVLLLCVPSQDGSK